MKYSSSSSSSSSNWLESSTYDDDAILQMKKWVCKVKACELFLAYVHFFGGLYEFPTNKWKQKSLFIMLVLSGLGWRRPWVRGVKGWHRKQYQGVALSMCLTAEGATSSSTHPVQYILQITKIALSLWNLLLLWIIFFQCYLSLFITQRVPHEWRNIF